ncbi:HIT domain-containing protein [Acidipropionibacterium acidipropionici]|jgi:ATP adenylyltransferase|uniref:HIT family hydrolase n=1 Tax=Acidipropionibacterium acidipropionici TaxID=1748 RepID=A0AAC8YDQ1_9ACTN|nr:HIT domain-containing protein [Acidipropionibacterium acidipropionici]AMS04578.1 HIT family hydrolase [Acidipropionibacterium acidipropionici]AOZ46068.1 HIT family hydrolase [Acidipropionibacterium acidipropionici]AZP37907.1 HIT domain-containing protein [Acidipropionibacterium acidipropionici]QCV95105.1 HIT domain-containing protein [Acidipropionibacterium acidipropionici]
MGEDRDSGAAAEAIRVEFAADQAGIPDPFRRLWTPYRMAYIDGENKPADDREGQGCPFCRAPGQTDDQSLIVHRGRYCYVIMNLYPYSPGHLLVCPYRHMAGYIDATPEETREMAELSQSAIRVLTATSHPQGFNLGMNQGAAGGAGVAAHLHQHVVPRWVGDTNFLPITGGTRAIPQLLGDGRAMLAEAWEDHA